ncbi:MAG: FecR domain-containing protein [Verrucomicrobiota bacterium]
MDRCFDSMMDVLLEELLGNDVPPDIRDRVVERIGSEDVNETREMGIMGAAEAPKITKTPLVLAFVSIGFTTALSWVFPGIFGLIESQKNTAPIVFERPVLAKIYDPFAEGVPVGQEGIDFEENPFQEPAIFRVGDTYEPDHFSNTIGEQIDIEYQDGSIVSIYEDTNLRLPLVESTEGSEQIILETGRLYCAIASQSGKKPFVMATPFSSVQTMGSDFEFGYDESALRVVVERGEVVLKSKNSAESTTIAAGQFAVINEAGILEKWAIPSEFSFTLLDTDSQSVINRYFGEEIVMDLELSQLPTRNVNLDFASNNSVEIEHIKFRIEQTKINGRKFESEKLIKNSPYFVMGKKRVAGIDLAKNWKPVFGRYEINVDIKTRDYGEFTQVCNLIINVSE